MFDPLKDLFAVLLYGDGDRIAEALDRTVFGSLLAPRGLGFAALAIAVLCSVAVIRARRIYERTVNIGHVGYHDVYDDTSQLAYKLEAKLLDEVRAKMAMVAVWLSVALMLFAIQAHLLSLDAAVWGDEERSRLFAAFVDAKANGPDGPEMVYLIAARNLFGLLALAAFSVWVTLTFWNETNDSPATRLRKWWHGLVDPTARPAPTPQEAPGAAP